jgi:hypothetical protein
MANVFIYIAPLMASAFVTAAVSVVDSSTPLMRKRPHAIGMDTDERTSSNVVSNVQMRSRPHATGTDTDERMNSTGVRNIQMRSKIQSTSSNTGNSISVGESTGSLMRRKSAQAPTQVSLAVQADGSTNLMRRSAPSSSHESSSGFAVHEVSKDVADVTNEFTVTCTFHMLYEDYHVENHSSDGFEYAECIDHLPPGETYYLLDDDMTNISFGNINHEDNVTLSLQATTTRPTSTVDQPAWFSEYQFYEVKAIHNIASALELTAGSAAHETETKEMTVLTILCKYDDFAPTASETSATNQLYGVTDDEVGTMKDVIEKNSLGRLTLPRNKGRTITVDMGVSWLTQLGCPVSDIAEAALNKVSEQFGDVDLNSFTFREFLIPSHRGDGQTCGWGGLADVGCGHYSLLPQLNSINSVHCRAWFRSSSNFVRAHELGHNLGLLHAGANSGGNWLEYADKQAIMGASYVFSSFNAAARYQMGVLNDGPLEVIDWTSLQVAPITIQSISIDAVAQNGAEYVAIKVKCDACVPQVSSHASRVGGYLWVQYRGDEGYSSLNLAAEYQNKVYVHLARMFTNIRFGKGTELWATLSAGESYTPTDLPYTIHVCSIEGDLARVSIAATEGQAVERCDSAASTAQWPQVGADSSKCGLCSGCSVHNIADQAECQSSAVAAGKTVYMFRSNSGSKCGLCDTSTAVGTGLKLPWRIYEETTAPTTVAPTPPPTTAALGQYVTNADAAPYNVCTNSANYEPITTEAECRAMQKTYIPSGTFKLTGSYMDWGAWCFRYSGATGTDVYFNTYPSGGSGKSDHVMVCKRKAEATEANQADYDIAQDNKYCSNNWQSQHDAHTTEASVAACKTQCDASASCAAISYSEVEGGKCVQCSTTAVGTHANWVTYVKQASTTQVPTAAPTTDAPTTATYYAADGQNCPTSLTVTDVALCQIAAESLGLFHQWRAAGQTGAWTHTPPGCWTR